MTKMTGEKGWSCVQELVETVVEAKLKQHREEFSQDIRVWLEHIEGKLDAILRKQKKEAKRGK